MNEELDELAPAIQTDQGVKEAIPISEIAASPADIPPDYGTPGAVDFADPAWDEVDDEEEGERPDPDEPDDDDADDLEDADDAVEDVAPAMLEEDELPELDEPDEEPT